MFKSREYQGVKRTWIFDNKTGTQGHLYQHPDGRTAYVHGSAGTKKFADGTYIPKHQVTEDGIQVDNLFFPWI